MYIQPWSLPSTIYNFLICPRECCSLWTVCEDIVQCTKTEAAGTIVYAPNHKKMRAHPVSTMPRKISTDFHKIKNKIILKLFNFSLL